MVAPELSLASSSVSLGMSAENSSALWEPASECKYTSRLAVGEKGRSISGGGAQGFREEEAGWEVVFALWWCVQSLQLLCIGSGVVSGRSSSCRAAALAWARGFPVS
eukprot:4634354-Prorocentrum_lima.AAC.1